MNQKDWDQYFFSILDIVKSKSTCIRRKVGALAVRDTQILATGYNGAPSKVTHCTDRGCIRQKNNVPSGTEVHLCYAVHAEQNVICQAAKLGTSLKGASLFVDTFPCSICAKLIINAGFEELVVGHIDYPDDLAKEVFAEAGIRIRKVGEKNV